MYSTKLSVSVHMLLLVATSQMPITSERMSESINTNPVVVRKLISKLQKADLIETKRNIGITKLKKDIKDISLLDIFLAVEPQTALFGIHHNVNLQCSVGAVIESTLADVYKTVEEPLYASLSTITLDHLLEKASLKDK